MDKINRGWQQIIYYKLFRNLLVIFDAEKEYAAFLQSREIKITQAFIAQHRDARLAVISTNSNIIDSYVQKHYDTIKTYSIMPTQSAKELKSFKKNAMMDLKLNHKNAYFIGIGDSPQDSEYIDLCHEGYLVDFNRLRKIK